MQFKGAHGTTRNCADSIIKHNFEVDAAGRGGNGAYFWAALSEEQVELSVYFAYQWAQRNSPYAEHRAIVVDIEVNEDEVLYLDDPEHHLELRSHLMRAVEARFGMKAYLVSRDKVKGMQRELFGIVDRYVRMIEEELGSPIKVVFKSQVAPIQDPLREIVGLAPCFAVRDVTCIKNPQVH